MQIKPKLYSQGMGLHRQLGYNHSARAISDRSLLQASLHLLLWSYLNWGQHEDVNSTNLTARGVKAMGAVKISTEKPCWTVTLSRSNKKLGGLFLWLTVVLTYKTAPAVFWPALAELALNSIWTIFHSLHGPLFERLQLKLQLISTKYLMEAKSWSLHFSMSTVLPAALHSWQEVFLWRCRNEMYGPWGRNDKSWHEGRIL